MRQEERRARTTTALLDAATTVFARQGVRTATVDDVARAAGYTKGAVYANFGSKDALVLAVLDRHLEDQVAQVGRLAAAATGQDLREVLQRSSARQMADQDFGILMLELWLYAARHPDARAALAERYQRMRAALAAASDRWRSDGACPTTAADAATLALALDAGLFLMHLLDPQAVTPELRAMAVVATLGL